MDLVKEIRPVVLDMGVNIFRERAGTRALEDGAVNVSWSVNDVPRRSTTKWRWWWGRECRSSCCAFEWDGGRKVWGESLYLSSGGLQKVQGFPIAFFKS